MRHYLFTKYIVDSMTQRRLLDDIIIVPNSFAFLNPVTLEALEVKSIKMFERLNMDGSNFSL